jgi:hypothetical protein
MNNPFVSLRVLRVPLDVLPVPDLDAQTKTLCLEHADYLGPLLDPRHIDVLDSWAACTAPDSFHMASPWCSTFSPECSQMGISASYASASNWALMAA